MRHRPLSLQLSLGGGLVALAFAAGRAFGEGPAAAAESSPTWAEGLVEPTEAAQLVSEALQKVAAEAEPQVVQVGAFRESSRRRGLRKLQDGSGVVVRRGGIVVTNQHVVNGATALRVTLHDGTVREAALIGEDQRTDLAVLRVKELDIEPMELASDYPAVGELVLAMGNPLGYGHTVTLGVVNGLGRSNLDIAQYEDFIQTDAAINPGNSGGPLVDLRGQAVGLNVAMGLESNGDGGLAFAIPSRMVTRVVDQILEKGRIDHGWFGTRNHWSRQFDRIAGEDRVLGYEGHSRIKVRSVESGSPAAAAGLKSGDILLYVGDRRITDEQSFRNAVFESSPGDRVEVTLWRAGKELVVPLSITARVD